MSTNKNGSSGPSPHLHAAREARRAHRRERKRAIRKIRRMFEEAEDMKFREYDLCGRPQGGEPEKFCSLTDVIQEVFVPPGPLVVMQGYFTKPRLNRSSQVEPSRYTFQTDILTEPGHPDTDDYRRLLWRLKQTLPEEETSYDVELFSGSDGQLQFVQSRPSQGDSQRAHDASARNQEVGEDGPRWVAAGISRKTVEELSKISSKRVGELFREAEAIQPKFGEYSHVVTTEVLDMEKIFRQRAPTVPLPPSLVGIRKEAGKLAKSTIWILGELERLGDGMLRSAREGASPTDDEVQNLRNLIHAMEDQETAWKAHKKKVDDWRQRFFKVLNRVSNPDAQEARDGPDVPDQPRPLSKAIDALRGSLASLDARKSKDASTSDHGSKSDKQTGQGQSSSRLRGIAAAIGASRFFPRGKTQDAGSSGENQLPGGRSSAEVWDQALLPGRPGHGMLPARTDALRPQPAPSHASVMNPSTNLSYNPYPAPSVGPSPSLQTNPPPHFHGSRTPPWRIWQRQQASQSQMNPQHGYNAASSNPVQATPHVVPRGQSSGVGETTQRFAHLSMSPPMVEPPLGVFQPPRPPQRFQVRPTVASGPAQAASLFGGGRGRGRGGIATPVVHPSSAIPPPLPPRHPQRQQQQEVVVIEDDDSETETRPSSNVQGSGNDGGDGDARRRRGGGDGSRGSG